MTERFRVGTRRSPLARVQTAWVLARLARAAPGVRFEPVAVDTSGDRDRSVGSSPDFTDTIDRALLRGEVVRVVEVRGNVETRIGLVRSGTIDAAILAVAGLSRLGRTGEIGRILPPTS